MKKQNVAIFLIILSVLAFVISSCKKDEGFHEVSALEQQIHQKINDHRQENQLTALVFQPILFKEARKHSMKMANLETITDDGLEAVFDDLISKIGGTDAAFILDASQYAIADTIVNGIFSNTETNALTLGTFTQGGVGVYAGTDQINYVTILLLNIPD